MQYYEDLQYLAQVDRQDRIIGKIEKWQAHEQGILHRGLTITVFYKDYVLLQHRKHPIFDAVFDLTVSTHQYFAETKLSDDQLLAMQLLKRELNLTEADLLEKPLNAGQINYHAKDPNSKYSEDEICHVMTCKVKKINLPNLDFAYGFTLQKLQTIANPNYYLYPLFAPWAKTMLSNNII